VSGGGSVTSISPSLTATTTYHAQSRNTTTGCVSAARTAVVTTVNAVPAAPTMGGAGTHCEGAATITATYGSGGNAIKWDDNSTDASRRVTTTGTYRAITTSTAGCTSSTATVSVTIGTPSASGSAPDPACNCATNLTVCNGTCQASCSHFTACDGITEVTSEVSEGGKSYLGGNAAENVCKSKGSGWRLPTVQELQCMCEHRAELPEGYTNRYYWSSDYYIYHGDTYFYIVWFNDDTCSVSESRIGYGSYWDVRCVK
jgi:hypothetical protein